MEKSYMVFLTGSQIERILSLLSKEDAEIGEQLGKAKARQESFITDDELGEIDLDLLEDFLRD